MFKRRNPLKPLQLLKEIFWPTMGWVRSFHYAQRRIVRLSDTTPRIALGLSIGMAISFTPLIGTHFIQAGFIAYTLGRANILAALIGTFVGNPWTFPFMWYSAMQFGSVLFGLMGLPADTALPDEMSFDIMWELITNDPLRVFLPWALGGYLLGALSIGVSYFIFYYFVKSVKAARAKVLMANKDEAS